MDEVFEKLEQVPFLSFKLFGIEVELFESILVMWIVMAVMIIGAILVGRNLSKDKPGRVQRVVEMLADFVNNLCKESIGHHWRSFTPYLGTLLVFLVISNIITIFNFFPFINLYPPTKDINVSGAFALMSIFMVAVSGFRFKGVKGWVKHLAHPIPMMAPFNVLEYVIRPMSLCLRLFGNVVAAFVVMELVIHFIPLAGSLLSVYFDLFDGILQAYIFVFLTTLYIGEAVEG